MQKPFGVLFIGDKFYRKKSDGSVDIRWVYMKVSPIRLTEEPSASFKVTERALKAKKSDCVILTSPNGTDGWYDYVEQTDLVLISPKYTC